MTESIEHELIRRIACVDIQVGTVWLTQKLMAELYGEDVRTINEHLQNIYTEGELAPEATIRKFRMVQTERRGCLPPSQSRGVECSR